MNVFVKSNEIPSMILQDIKETKRYGHTVGRSEGRTDNFDVIKVKENRLIRVIMYYSNKTFSGVLRGAGVGMFKVS